MTPDPATLSSALRRFEEIARRLELACPEHREFSAQIRDTAGMLQAHPMPPPPEPDDIDDRDDLDAGHTEAAK